MKISFFSNFLTPHQLYFSNSIMKFDDVDYTFVANIPFNSGEVADSFEDMNKLPFVLETYKSRENEEKALELAADSDILICGSSDERYVKAALDNDVLVLRYSERILKKGTFHALSPRARFNVKKYHTDNMDKKMYMLCSSAYTAADFSRFGAYKRKTYKWGYFPETKHYQMDALYAQKDKQKILWVGRFLDWKHPDDVLRVAKRLKEDGYSFSMDIAGTGEMEQQLKDMSEAMGLNDCVTFLGPIPSNRVRELMEKAGIYLFTSDRYEGWGAVLNESMNSGCAVVASHAIGAVPYLMRNQENGLIYHSGNVDELYKKVKYLLDNPGEQERLGKAAYETIVGEWNAEVAAERLINLSEHLLAGEKYPDLYRTGPCSRAEIIKDDWFYEYRTATL